MQMIGNLFRYTDAKQYQNRMWFDKVNKKLRSVELILPHKLLYTHAANDIMRSFSTICGNS